MFSGIHIIIEQSDTEVFQIKLYSTVEKKSVVQYNFCDCGVAFAEPVKVSDTNYIIYVNRNNIPDIDINTTVDNTESEITSFVSHIITLELDEPVVINHIFDLLFSLHNHSSNYGINKLPGCHEATGVAK